MRLDPATIAAHGVRAPSPEALPDGTRSVPSAEPLYAASVYDFPSIEASDRPLAMEGGYVYARYAHPNGRTLELTVAALEGTEEAVATSSGMAAIACTALACAQAGDTLAIQSDSYGGTVALFATELARLGIATRLVNPYAPASLALDGARALIVETISNPLAREVDVPALAAACRAAGALLIVDNTFATPVIARPVEQGADVVVHSATKFLGGHHDLTAGVIAGRAELCARARGVAKRLGTTVSPFDAWLACRGLKTLGVRVERAQANARAISARLAEDPRVRAVHYPGRGAVLSFEVADAARFVRAVKLLTLTPSLGGTTSTLSHPATSSHRGLGADKRAELGIRDGLLRLSVGIEAVEDLFADLDRGLAAAS